MSKWQSLDNKKNLQSVIPKIKNLCKTAKPLPSFKAVHTAPCSLYFLNINISKP